MHLGRFHAVIEDLNAHFSEKDIVSRIARCMHFMNDYAQTRNPISLDKFKENLATLYQAAEIEDQNLKQPYAQEVIKELNIEKLFAPKLVADLKSLSIEKAFDLSELVKSLKVINTDASEKIKNIKILDEALTKLNVEYQRVPNDCAEIGFLLPREAVGETLKNLSSEFLKIGLLAKAINELTGASDYEPKVATISSSEWQVFLELGPAQLLIWVAAIERIVALYKSGLEIRSLQRRATEIKLSEAVTKVIEAEVNKQFAEGIEKIAADIRNDFSTSKDDARNNELENQIRQGLSHIANRMAEGAQIEINIGESAPHLTTDGKPIEENLLEASNELREKLESMRQLRNKAFAASAETVVLEKSEMRLQITDQEDHKTA